MQKTVQGTVKKYNSSNIKLIKAHEFCELIVTDRYRTKNPIEDPPLKNKSKCLLTNADDWT